MYRYAIILSIGLVGLVAVVFAASNIDTQDQGYHWAWNDVIGWISFDGGNYGVTIQPAGDGTNSFFRGWAWNDVVGWISMHCDNQSLCITFPTYRVQTGAGSQETAGVLESNVFDTGKANPAYNYVLWRGVPKVGGSVKLALASSDNANGPWNFDLPTTAAVDQKVVIGSGHQEKRYIKYQLIISTDAWGSNSPIVEDVVISYSP